MFTRSSPAKPSPILLLVALLWVSPASVRAQESAAADLYFPELAVRAPIQEPAPTEGPSQAALEAAARFHKAGDALERGEHAEAARLYEALQVDLGWPEAAYGAALAHARLGKMGAALEAARVAAKGRPEDPAFRFVEGALLQASSKHLDAVASLERAAAAAEASGLAGLGAMAWMARGESQRMTGDLRGALASFDRATAMAETTSRAALKAGVYERQALVFSELGRHAEAEGRRAAAEALVPGGLLDVASIQLAVAEGLRKLRGGDRAGATAELDSAVRRVTSLPQSLARAQGLRAVADLEYQLGQWVRARKRLSEAEALHTALGVPQGRVSTALLRASWALAEEDWAGAGQALAAAESNLAGVQAPSLRALTRLLQAQLAAAEGRWLDGLSSIDEAGHWFRDSGFANGQLSALRVRARLLIGSGDGRASLRVLDEAIGLAKNLGPHEAADVAVERIERLAVLGEIATAEREIVALGSAWNRAAPLGRLRARHELCRAQLAAGDLAGAEVSARAGWADAAGARVEREQRVAMARAYLEVLLRSGRTAEAARFAAEEGLSAEVASAVDSRARVDAYNAAVEAYNRRKYDDAARAARTLATASGAAEDERRSAWSLAARALLAQAEDRYVEGGAEDAARIAGDAAAAAVSAQSLPMEAAAALVQAQALLDLGRAEDSARAATRAARQGAADVALAGRAQGVLGDALADKDPAAARLAYELALTALAARPEATEAAAVWSFNLALLLAEAGDAAGARLRYENALALAGQAGRKDLEAQAREGLARARP